MSYFKTCPHCGAHLNPGETCDCRDKKNAPASSAKADGGGVEQTLTGAVPSYDNTNMKEDAR